MFFWQEALQIEDWILEQRRVFHRWPERSTEEYQTAARIETLLQSMGLEPRRIAGTGVMADLIGGKPGPVIALRADIDALPVTEETGLPFTSENPGVMHACGHDVHMAALLGAARLLTDHREDLPGTVRFLFQPDEEVTCGAARMVEAGCMEGVSMVFGAHVRPDLPAGTVGIIEGPFYAANRAFDIQVCGRGTHGAEPHNGVDAIVAAGQILSAVQSVVSRQFAPIEPAVVTIGTIHGGTQQNIVADTVEMSGIIRCFGEENMARLETALRKVVTGTATAMGARAEFRSAPGHPGIINDPAPTALVRMAAEKALGREYVVEDKITMVSEDFGFYQKGIPGCFYHFGVGGPASLHSSTFSPEETALASASAVHAQVAWEALTAAAAES